MSLLWSALAQFWKWFCTRLQQLILIPFFTCFLQGCYDTVRDMFLKNYWWVIGVSVTVLALQVLGIIFAFCLCKAIGKDYDRDYHYKYWPRAESRDNYDPSQKPDPPSRKKKNPKKNAEQNQDEEAMLVLQWINEKIKTISESANFINMARAWRTNFSKPVKCSLSEFIHPW